MNHKLWFIITKFEELNYFRYPAYFLIHTHCVVHSVYYSHSMVLILPTKLSHLIESNYILFFLKYTKTAILLYQKKKLIPKKSISSCFELCVQWFGYSFWVNLQSFCIYNTIHFNENQQQQLIMVRKEGVISPEVGDLMLFRISCVL